MPFLHDFPELCHTNWSGQNYVLFAETFSGANPLQPRSFGVFDQVSRLLKQVGVGVVEDFDLCVGDFSPTRTALDIVTCQYPRVATAVCPVLSVQKPDGEVVPVAPLPPAMLRENPIHQGFPPGVRRRPFRGIFTPRFFRETTSLLKVRNAVDI